jgi:hypothetical protein
LCRKYDKYVKVKEKGIRRGKRADLKRQIGAIFD